MSAESAVLDRDGDDYVEEGLKETERYLHGRDIGGLALLDVSRVPEVRLGTMPSQQRRVSVGGFALRGMMPRIQIARDGSTIYSFS